MKTGKRLYGLVIAALVAGFRAGAGRPLSVDDTEPVEQGRYEVEAGVGFVGDGPLRHWDFPCALTCGLLPRLDAGVGFGGHIEERRELLGNRNIVTDLNDVTAAAKMKLLDQEAFGAGQALAATVKFPTADREKGTGSGQFDYDLTWILSRRLNERWGAHLNLGYLLTGDADDEIVDNALHYGLATDFQLSDPVQLVAEVFAFTPDTERGDTGMELRGGLRWCVSDTLTLDAAAGAGVVGPAAPMTATVGLTWAP